MERAAQKLRLDQLVIQQGRQTVAQKGSCPFRGLHVACFRAERVATAAAQKEDLVDMIGCDDELDVFEYEGTVAGKIRSTFYALDVCIS